METDILTSDKKLSEAKRKLLEIRLRGKRKKLTEQEDILPKYTLKTPLSFTQERLWFVYSLDPESSAYNIPILLKFRGRLYTQVLEESLEERVRRIL